MRKLLFFILLFCLTINNAFAASVEISNCTPEDLKTSLMKFFIKEGATIEKATEYSLITKARKTSFAYTFLFGSSFNYFPEVRSHYSFIKEGNNTVLSANIETVTNPNSAYEHSVPLADNYAQESLNQLKKAIEGYYGYGLDFKKRRKYIEIIVVTSDCSAFEQLNVGSRVYMINGEPVKGMSKYDCISKFSTSKSGESLKLMVGKKNPYEITIVSKFINPILVKEK